MCLHTTPECVLLEIRLRRPRNIYLAVNTHPDISYIINALAQHNATPEPHHFAPVKHVLHYLVDTLDLWLHYQSDLDDSCLFAYANASWENELGCWSVSGYTWYYARGLISHVLKKKSTVALLSTKAEYIASAHVIQEGLWLWSLFAKLCISFASPVPIYLDNTSMITLSSVVKFHQCMKHIDLWYHFIHLCVDNGSFVLIWVPSHCNPASFYWTPASLRGYVSIPVICILLLIPQTIT